MKWEHGWWNGALVFKKHDRRASQQFCVVAVAAKFVKKSSRKADLAEKVKKSPFRMLEGRH